MKIKKNKYEVDIIVKWNTTCGFCWNVTFYLSESDGFWCQRYKDTCYCSFLLAGRYDSVKSKRVLLNIVFHETKVFCRGLWSLCFCQCYSFFNFQSDFEQQTYLWMALEWGDTENVALKWNYESRKDEAEIIYTLTMAACYKRKRNTTRACFGSGYSAWGLGAGRYWSPTHQPLQDLGGRC